VAVPLVRVFDAVSLVFQRGHQRCLLFNSQLSAMDASARAPMKNAAKCDKHCELQNSVNQQNFERSWRFWDTPKSMSASVSPLFHAKLWCFCVPAKTLAHEEYAWFQSNNRRVCLRVGWFCGRCDFMQDLRSGKTTR